MGHGSQNNKQQTKNYDAKRQKFKKKLRKSLSLSLYKSLGKTGKKRAFHLYNI